MLLTTIRTAPELSAVTETHNRLRSSFLTHSDTSKPQWELTADTTGSHSHVTLAVVVETVFIRCDGGRLRWCTTLKAVCISGGEVDIMWGCGFLCLVYEEAPVVKSSVQRIHEHVFIIFVHFMTGKSWIKRLSANILCYLVHFPFSKNIFYV